MVTWLKQGECEVFVKCWCVGWLGNSLDVNGDVQVRYVCKDVGFLGLLSRLGPVCLCNLIF